MSAYLLLLLVSNFRSKAFFIDDDGFLAFFSFEKLLLSLLLMILSSLLLLLTNSDIDFCYLLLYTRNLLILNDKLFVVVILGLLIGFSVGFFFFEISRFSCYLFYYGYSFGFYTIMDFFNNFCFTFPLSIVYIYLTVFYSSCLYTENPSNPNPSLLALTH